MRLKRFAFRNGGITAFSMAVLIRIVFGINAGLYDAIYFKFLFPVIRNVQSFLNPIWIIPGYYALIILGLAWLLFRLLRRENWILFFKKLVNFLGLIAAIFLFLWGFNYANVGYAVRSELPALPDSTNLAGQYEAVMSRAMSYRDQIDGITKVATIEDIAKWPSDAKIDRWVQAVLLPKGYPAKPAIRVRHIYPKGALRRLSISGIYNPFSGEANVDSALPQLLLTFTTAHEIAHAYGITSEAEANFVAYLACIQSENPKAEYAAEYVLWRYIAHEINRTFSENQTEVLAAKIPEALRKDRQAIFESYYRYKGYFPKVTDAINDTYLKMQGIKSGTADYNDFVKLYLQWETQKNDL